MGENTYYPEEDNLVRINLNNGISDVTKDLTIITYDNNSNLTDGTYYFKISSYASYDGYYSNQSSTAEINIPVRVVNNSINVIYNFDVIMDDANRIINKNAEPANVIFNILQNGTLKNPNIRVALYEKNEMTAYNQEYSPVNLEEYVSDNLSLAGPNSYYVSTNPVKYTDTSKLYNNFELNLITDNFNNTGYKFVFYLYDGSKKIGTIEKHFIIK